MAYKLPITKEKFIEATQIDEKTKTANTQEKEQEDNSKSIRERLDYYLSLMEKYRGKTINDLATEKYAGEYVKADARTDQDLYNEAKLKADTEREEKANRAIAKTDKEVASLNKKEADTREKSNEEIAKIEKTYSNAEKASKNTAIKNGIARSSIIAELLKSSEKEKKNLTQSVKDKEKTDLDAISAQIQLLESDLKSSLENFDMQSAITLNDQLTKLKTERDKRNADIAKHNAEVDKKITNYANELVKTEDGKAIKDYIENNSGKLVSEAKNLLIKYYDSLPLEKAYEELSTGEVERLFGVKTVTMLKNYLDTKAKSNKNN